jgi:hypothetical protein
MGEREANVPAAGEQSQHCSIRLWGHQRPDFARTKLQREDHHESTHYVDEHRAPELGRLCIPAGELCTE